MPSLNQKTKGIILRKINFSENDVIFDILSQEGNILGFIAKGARKMKSRFSGVLQLGLVVSVTYSKGKNLNYPNEITLDSESVFSFYSKSLQHMNFYMDVITITRAVAKDLEDPEIFEMVQNAFRRVQNNEDIVEVYNDFLSQILSLISADIELRCAMSGEQINEPEFYYSSETNKVFNEKSKPQSIQLPKINFSQDFYRQYLQKLLLEHINARMRLKFK